MPLRPCVFWSTRKLQRQTPPPPPPLLKRKREYLLCSSGKCVLTDKSHKKFRHLPCLRRPVPIEHCIELVNINLDYHWLKIFILNKCCELLCPLQIFWPVIIVQSIPLILPILLKKTFHSKSCVQLI